MNERTMTTKELLSFFGVSRNTIYRATEKLDIKKTQGKKKEYTKKEVEMISKELYKKMPEFMKIAIDEAFNKHTCSNGTSKHIPNEHVSSQNGNLELSDDEINRAFRLTIINMSNMTQGLMAKANEHEARLNNIEKQVEKRKALLPPPQIKPREHINMIIRKYVHDTGVSHADAWGELYKQFYYRTKTNAKVCAKNRGMGTLDYIESEGMIEMLEAIAIDFFKED